ncbi:Retrovirus-related Pol polyprotein LINE-1 [Gossypium australe]|uniref:Retrovirus-related Pol polyprotein LINE-1 n=1 Tax=Gossypium australe TaxID=47621 RepID=A0A5B6VXM7_9ROSI|nr:Retrovirus-related Pol polyprotein LINE-1 [Gossypium australe]
MAIKIDLEKTYDRICWDFIGASLQAARIPNFLNKVLWMRFLQKNSSLLEKSVKEWLGQGVHLAISSGKWQTIYLLIIFNKADMQCAQLLKETLENFCGFSGHCVNARKTNIFFSRGVDDGLGSSISKMIGFQKVQNLDKVHSKLHNWNARQLCFAVRVTIAQSVLLSILNYFKQSMLIPKGICEKIECLDDRKKGIFDTMTNENGLWVQVLRSK